MHHEIDRTMNGKRLANELVEEEKGLFGGWWSTKSRPLVFSSDTNPQQQ